MDPAKVAQMVEVLNGFTARDALCLLVGRILTVLDEAPSDEERQQSLDGCIDLLKGVPAGLRHLRTACGPGCEKLPKLKNRENGFSDRSKSIVLRNCRCSNFDPKKDLFY
jgi:hypothetical protein